MQFSFNLRTRLRYLRRVMHFGSEDENRRLCSARSLFSAGVSRRKASTKCWIIAQSYSTGLHSYFCSAKQQPANAPANGFKLFLEATKPTELRPPSPGPRSGNSPNLCYTATPAGCPNSARATPQEVRSTFRFASDTIRLE